MTHYEIIYRLCKLGYQNPVTEIADLLLVKKPLVSRVIRGSRESRRVMNFIASEIGIPADRIWPDNKQKKAA